MSPNTIKAISGVAVLIGTLYFGPGVGQLVGSMLEGAMLNSQLQLTPTPENGQSMMTVVPQKGHDANASQQRPVHHE